MAFTARSSHQSSHQRGAVFLSTADQAHIAMAPTTSPTPAETLATYVVKGEGCFTLGPVEALMRLVPDLGQERHKGQVHLREHRCAG